MGTTAIQKTLGEIIDKPVLFLLVTVLVYLALVAVLAAVCYVIACLRSKGTQMTGLMHVGVTLNVWPSDSKDQVDLTNAPVLRYGDFWIDMADPKLKPVTSWKDLARHRRYRLGTMLKALYWPSFQAAGLGKDPSGKMLKALLESEDFRRRLGVCCFKGAAGRLIVEAPIVAEARSEGCKGAVYTKIDGTTKVAGCDVKTLCVTLEYRK